VKEQSNMTTIAVHTDHLTRTFGTFRAADQVSLEVPAGTVYGFLGPNGAGKTTTIGIILGLLHATSGQVRIFGEPVTPTHTAPLRRVGSLVGPVGMEPHLSARQNLHLLRYLHPTVERRRIDVVLDQVGLLHAADRRIANYSLGMRQRLGLAAALFHQPDLLILDEPTNGLDPAGMREMRTLLRALPEQGVTVFLSSHLLHEVEQTCTHVAVLNQGRVVAQGRVDDLLNREQTVRVRVPSAAAAADVLRSLPGITSIRAEERDVLLAGVPSEQVLMHLMSHGIVPSELHNGQSDLESVFFSLTQATHTNEGDDRVLEYHAS
jgi:ABC-2 type transport system ATP-binding protein